MFALLILGTPRVSFALKFSALVAGRGWRPDVSTPRHAAAHHVGGGFIVIAGAPAAFAHRAFEPVSVDGTSIHPLPRHLRRTTSGQHSSKNCSTRKQLHNAPQHGTSQTNLGASYSRAVAAKAQTRERRTLSWG